MLRKALLISAVLAGTAVAGCSDDDFGQERPSADASASVTDAGSDGATGATQDLTPLYDMTPNG